MAFTLAPVIKKFLQDNELENAIYSKYYVHVSRWMKNSLQRSLLTIICPWPTTGIVVCANVSLSQVPDHNKLILSVPSYRAVLFQGLFLIEMLGSCRSLSPNIFLQYKVKSHIICALGGQKITKSKLLATIMLYESSATSADKYLNLCSAFKLFKTLQFLGGSTELQNNLKSISAFVYRSSVS